MLNLSTEFNVLNSVLFYLFIYLPTKNNIILVIPHMEFLARYSICTVWHLSDMK